MTGHPVIPPPTRTRPGTLRVIIPGRTMWTQTAWLSNGGRPDTSSPASLLTMQGKSQPWRMSVPGEGNASAMDARSDPAYALERSQEEYQRLSEQAAFLGGTTERLFRAAGLGPGMRVLDVGSGAGDVALLAAELVGPEGEVVGVESDGAALETARGRDTESRAEQPDPGRGRCAHGRPRRWIRRRRRPSRSHVHGRPCRCPAAARQRGSGRAVWWPFRSSTSTRSISSLSLPDETLWNETGRLVIETFTRAGTQMRMGRRLFGAFLGAGLAAPTMRDESVVGGGRDFAGYEWLAGVTGVLRRRRRKLKIADTNDLGLETLADRLREDTVARNAVVWTPSLVGAYVTSIRIAAVTQTPRPVTPGQPCCESTNAVREPRRSSSSYQWSPGRYVPTLHSWPSGSRTRDRRVPHSVSSGAITSLAPALMARSCQVSTSDGCGSHRYRPPPVLRPKSLGTS